MLVKRNKSQNAAMGILASKRMNKYDWNKQCVKDSRTESIYAVDGEYINSIISRKDIHPRTIDMLIDYCRDDEQILIHHAGKEQMVKNGDMQTLTIFLKYVHDQMDLIDVVCFAYGHGQLNMFIEVLPLLSKHRNSIQGFAIGEAQEKMVEMLH